MFPTSCFLSGQHFKLTNNVNLFGKPFGLCFGVLPTCQTTSSSNPFQFTSEAVSSQNASVVVGSGAGGGGESAAVSQQANSTTSTIRQRSFSVSIAELAHNGAEFYMTSNNINTSQVSRHDQITVAAATHAAMNAARGHSHNAATAAAAAVSSATQIGGGGGHNATTSLLVWQINASLNDAKINKFINNQADTILDFDFIVNQGWLQIQI